MIDVDMIAPPAPATPPTGGSKPGDAADEFAVALAAATDGAAGAGAAQDDPEPVAEADTVEDHDDETSEADGGSPGDLAEVIAALAGTTGGHAADPVSAPSEPAEAELTVAPADSAPAEATGAVVDTGSEVGTGNVVDVGTTEANVPEAAPVEGATEPVDPSVVPNAADPGASNETPGTPAPTPSPATAAVEPAAPDQPSSDAAALERDEATGPAEESDAAEAIEPADAPPVEEFPAAEDAPAPTRRPGAGIATATSATGPDGVESSAPHTAGRMPAAPAAPAPDGTTHQPVPATANGAAIHVDAPPPATGTAPLPAPPPSPPGAPVQQVAEALREVRRLADGSHRLSLRLHPEELGSVQLEVAVRDGRLHVRAVAETEAARASLERSLPELRGQLRDAGVRTGSLEVGPETTGHETRADHGQRDDRSRPAGPGPVAPAGGAALPTPEHHHQTTGLDIRI